MRRGCAWLITVQRYAWLVTMPWYARSITMKQYAWVVTLFWYMLLRMSWGFRTTSYNKKWFWSKTRSVNQKCHTSALILERVVSGRLNQMTSGNAQWKIMNPKEAVQQGFLLIRHLDKYIRKYGFTWRQIPGLQWVQEFAPITWNNLGMEDL